MCVCVLLCCECVFSACVLLCCESVQSVCMFHARLCMCVCSVRVCFESGKLLFRTVRLLPGRCSLRPLEESSGTVPCWFSDLTALSINRLRKKNCLHRLSSLAKATLSWICGGRGFRDWLSARPRWGVASVCRKSPVCPRLVQTTGPGASPGQPTLQNFIVHDVATSTRALQV